MLLCDDDSRKFPEPIMNLLQDGISTGFLIEDKQISLAFAFLEATETALKCTALNID
jgi:hypothetical protein